MAENKYLLKAYNLINGAKMIAEKSNTEEDDAIADILEKALQEFWRARNEREE